MAQPGEVQGSAWRWSWAGSWRAAWSVRIVLEIGHGSPLVSVVSPGGRAGCDRGHGRCGARDARVAWRSRAQRAGRVGERSVRHDERSNRPIAVRWSAAVEVEASRGVEPGEEPARAAGTRAGVSSETPIIATRAERYRPRRGLRHQRVRPPARVRVSKVHRIATLQQTRPRACPPPLLVRSGGATRSRARAAGERRRGHREGEPDRPRDAEVGVRPGRPRTGRSPRDRPEPERGDAAESSPCRHPADQVRPRTPATAIDSPEDVDRKAANARRSPAPSGPRRPARRP